MQNKIVKITYITVIFILCYFILYFYYGARESKKDLETWARQTNNLNLQRDFVIYKALVENNLTKIKKISDLNFMLHLAAIETGGIKNMLDIRDIDRICREYNSVKVQFKKEYEKKYPSFIKDLHLFCKPSRI